MTRSVVTASHSNVHLLASQLSLSDAACRRALELASLTPDRADWLRLIDRFLGAVGALLIVAGVAAFFAWNWADLGAAAKFALIQAGIAGAVIVAWRLGLDSNAGRSALFSAAFMVGVLLAIYGQVYQTGADPYGLFLGWSLMILPWAILGRQAGLWLLIQALLNLALIMYWTQVLYPPSGWWQLSVLLGPLAWLTTTVMDTRLASYLFGLNAVALIIWEFLAARQVAWMAGRLYPRLAAIVAFTVVIIPTLIIVFGSAFGDRVGLDFLAPLLFAGGLAGCLYYYQYRKLDLFVLTIALFGAIMVIMAIAGRFMLRDISSALLLAMLLVSLVAGAAYWLREVSRRWEEAT